MRKTLQFLSLTLCFGLIFLVLKEKAEKAELTAKFTEKITLLNLKVDMLHQENRKAKETIQFVSDKCETEKNELRQMLDDHKSAYEKALLQKDSLHRLETEKMLKKFELAFNKQKEVFEQRLDNSTKAHERMIRMNNSTWKQRIKNLYFTFSPPSSLGFSGRKRNAKPVKMDSSETQRRIPAKLPANYWDMAFDIGAAIILVTILTAALQGLFRRRRRFRL